MDDHGTYAEKVYFTPTCAPLLKAGDTISSSGVPQMNPFRPGQSQVYIWRDITSNGTFSEGPVDAAILDYNGANPGYIPVGYPLTNNLTTPAVANLLVLGGAPALTESDVQNLYRSISPGVGANPVIYWYNGTTNGPDTITNILSAANTIQAGLSPGQLVKLILWTYVDQTTVTNVNAAAWGSSNAGIRYIASLPDNYTLINDQEAEALNYYGNSVWGQAPVVDVKRNMVYFGCGQTHNCPVDELLVYQDPAIEYLSRKQNVIDTMYQYAHPDESTDLAPYSTLDEVNTAKDEFIIQQASLNLDMTLKSPRGNMSYCDAIIAASLVDGSIEFAYRLLDWDAVTFTTDDPSLLVIQSGFADADASSGVMLMENIQMEGTGGSRTLLTATHKGSIIASLDISGMLPNIQWDHTNLLQKGVVPSLFYSGPDGALGGSNYGSCQDGGSKLIFADANDAAFFGSFSFQYNTGYYGGVEFHVTRDGRVFLPNNSFVAAFDVAKQSTVWETDLGQLTHSQVQSFNGVTFVPRGDGVVFGLDNANGEPIYMQDVFTPYGMLGITPPVFDDNGKSAFICNYQLPIVGNAGSMGSKGVLLDSNPCKLVTPKDDLKSLVNRRTFDSFDVVPKMRNEVVTLQLVNDQTVNHVWNSSGSLHATHVLTDLEGNETTLEADFEAEKFVYADQQILFSDYQTSGRLRYVSLTMMTREKYVLDFQLIDEYGAVQENCQATLMLTSSQAPQPCNRSRTVAKPSLASLEDVTKLSPKARQAHAALQQRESVMQMVMARHLQRKK